jgi:hypothetical protein
MLPPVTVSPSPRLMPSRWAFESRPFLELPRPFLCAIFCLFRAGPAAPGFKVPGAESPFRSVYLPLRPDKSVELLLFGLEALAADEDLVDLDFDEALAVALELLVLLLALVVEDEDLVAAAFGDDFGGDLGAAEIGLEANLPSSPETATMSEKVMAPSSWAAFSMRTVSPGATRYCFPPVLMTAYIA